MRSQRISCLIGSFLTLVALCSVNGATTKPVGAVHIQIPAGSVALAPVFINPDIFVGEIGSISEISLTSDVQLTGASFAGGEFNEGSFPLYYLEVIESGPLEGFLFDIISSDADSVVVSGLVGTDFGIAAGTQVAIRKHFTIGDLFSGAAGLQDFDSVTFYEDDGTPVAYFYVSPIWSADFGITDHTNKPIYPGNGIVTAFQGVVQLTTFGTVKYSATKIPLYANIVNITSAANPVELPVNGLGLESALADFELITTYAFDGNFSSPLAYFDVPGVGMSSNFVTESSDPILGFKAFVSSVSSDVYWTAPSAYVPPAP